MNFHIALPKTVSEVVALSSAGSVIGGVEIDLDRARHSTSPLISTLTERIVKELLVVIARVSLVGASMK